ncbi:MAG: hypothetical protein K0S45_3770 [Nitrospira sp.]|jgi:hypothetical protein|nr:hypothetical protein [Nitrospira sp.]
MNWNVQQWTRAGCPEQGLGEIYVPYGLIDLAHMITNRVIPRRTAYELFEWNPK